MLKKFPYLDLCQLTPILAPLENCLLNQIPRFPPFLHENISCEYQLEVSQRDLITFRALTRILKTGALPHHSKENSLFPKIGVPVP